MSNYTYYYLYKITNILNDKFYIGVHRTQNLNDGYMGSGKNIRRAIRKYGLEHFKFEILSFYDSEEEMLLAEQETVDEQFVLRSDTYNIAVGGGSFSHVQQYLNENPNIRHQISKKGGDAFKARIRNDEALREEYSNRLRTLNKERRDNGSFDPKVWVSEPNLKISKLVVLDSANTLLEKGWVRGRKFSNPAKGKKWIVNSVGTEEKFVPKEIVNDFLSKDWKLGRIKS